MNGSATIEFHIRDELVEMWKLVELYICVTLM